MCTIFNQRFLKSVDSLSNTQFEKNGAIDENGYPTDGDIDGGEGVSFESVKYPEQYIAIADSEMITAKPYDTQMCSVNVHTNESVNETEDYMDKAQLLIESAAPSGVFERQSGVEYGSVQKLTYYSNTAERNTPVNVILPPNYDKDKKYPVLYILHGFTDTQDWMLRNDVALVNMLGNLTNSGKIKEMIVVLPYIFCSRDQEKVNGFDISASPAYDNFINDLKTDVMKFINEKFPIAEGRENTAITGFSMGGRESLFIGTQMSDVFGYVGAVCPAPGLTPGADLNMHPGQLKKAELKYDKDKGVPYLTLISAGEKDDFVGSSPSDYHKLLTDNGEKNLWHIVPNGSHNASSVKQHLYNFTRMIFLQSEEDKKITIDSVTAGDNNITVSVTNGGSPAKACAIVAYYNEDNTLVDVSVKKDIDLKNGGSTFAVTNMKKGIYAKIFLWTDLGEMIPVTEYKSVNISKPYEVKEKELVINSGDKHIYGKLYSPDDEGRHPTVILSHGYNGCNEDFANECRYFVSNGFNAYAYDFCGGSTRSKSSGKSTDMTVFTEKADLLAVIDYMKNMDSVDTNRIYLFGGSQGGFVTALAAEERADIINGMVLYYPAFNIPDDWRNNFQSTEDIPESYDFWGLTLGKGFFTSIRDFYTFDNIGGFDKNVLIIQGDNDQIVSMNNAERAAALYSNAKLVVMNGEGHGFSAEAGKKAMKLALELFMK